MLLSSGMPVPLPSYFLLNSLDNSWAVSIVWFFTSFTSMIWATYGSFCESFDPLKATQLNRSLPDGRRVVFLYSMPCLTLGSVGVSLSRSVPELLFWRAVQATGSSAGISIGVAIIGDIYKLEERGTATGIAFAVRFPPPFHAGHPVNHPSSLGFPNRGGGFPIGRRNRRRVRTGYADHLAFIDETIIR